MSTMAPQRIRSMEFVEGALAQSDPGRASRLVLRALEADPANPCAIALLGHLDADLASACALYEGVGPVPDGASEACCAVAALAWGVLALANGEPFRALDETLPWLGTAIEPRLLVALSRVSAAAACAAGDVDRMGRAIAAYAPIAGQAPDLGWFRFLLACRAGSSDAGRRLDAAVASGPGVALPLLVSVVGAPPAANPGCLHPGVDALRVAQAAVMPGFASAPEAVAMVCERPGRA